MLAEFSIAVDAVQCAIEIQKELKTKNEDTVKQEFGGAQSPDDARIPILRVI